MTTADRLRQLMDIRGLRQKDIIDICQPLCQKYKVPIGKSHVSNYVKGRSVPDQRHLTVLSMALGVSEAWLMGLDVPMEEMDQDNLVPFPSNLKPAPEFRNVPRIGRIACGLPILAEENFDGYDSVPDTVKCDFTLICQGDSMINARIFDGDIVCIRAQEEVESGQVAAVMVGSDEATLKRVRIYDDHIVLEAENPLYKPLVFWEEEMNEIRIVGLATYIIGKII